MQTINYTPVRGYRLQGASGPLVLTEVSEWNGLTELRDDKGRRLIVALSSSAIAEAFAAFGVPAPCFMTIVSGSPDLLAELVEQYQKAARQPEQVTLTEADALADLEGRARPDNHDRSSFQGL